MAEKLLGHEFDIHGGGTRPALSPPRERARTIERARPRVRAHLDAQRHARARRREDVEVAGKRRDAPQRPRCLGSGGAARLPSLRSLEQAGRLLGRGHGAGVGTYGAVPRRLSQHARAGASGLVGAPRGGARRRLQYTGCARGDARVARSRAAASRARDLRAGVARGGRGGASRGDYSRGAQAGGEGSAGLRGG